MHPLLPLLLLQALAKVNMLSKLCLLACACMLCMLHTPISAQPLPLGVAQIKFDNIRYDIQPDDWIKYAKPAFFEVSNLPCLLCHQR